MILSLAAPPGSGPSSLHPPYRIHLKPQEWLTLIGGGKKWIFHGYLETSENMNFVSSPFQHEWCLMF